MNDESHPKVAPETTATKSDRILASVTPLRPDFDLDNDFESWETWTIPEVYNTLSDTFENVVIAAGWTSGAGQTVKLGDHQYTLGEALQLSKALTTAVTLLADTVTVPEWAGG